jgi:polysaccharide export outer membrane protein
MHSFLPLFGLFLLLNLTACAKTFQSHPEEEAGLSSAGEGNPEPAPQLRDLVLGEGDEVDIRVFRNPEFDRKTKITPDGLIFIPLAGEIKAAGVGVVALRREISDKLAAFIVQPQVSIDVTFSKSRKVYVLGEVRRPGVFIIDDTMNVIEAVSQAGGFTTDAAEQSVVVIRGDLRKPELKKVDFQKLVSKGDVAQNLALEKGDIVYIPATFVSDVDKFFRHVYTALVPIVALEQGIVLSPDVVRIISGRENEARSTTTNIVVTPSP